MCKVNSASYVKVILPQAKKRLLFSPDIVISS